MFYDVFSELCAKKGVSPNRACIEMNLSRSLAAKWKNTGANPSAEVLSKMSSYFGVTTDFLLGKEKSPSSEDLDGQLEGIEFALWGEVHDLTDAEKEDILEFVRFTKAKRKNKDK